MDETKTSGFTLIEIMIVVSIVGILAAVAIPTYQHMLFRSKRAEIPMLLDGIRSTEVGYYAEWGVYTSCVLSPSTVPGRVAADFPATISTYLDWNALGWVPDGRVYGQYEANAIAPTSVEASFIVEGYADIDGDLILSHYEADQLNKPEMLSSNIVY